MGGGKGEQAENIVKNDPAALSQLSRRSAAGGQLGDILTSYGTGGMSLQEALAAAKAKGAGASGGSGKLKALQDRYAAEDRDFQEKVRGVPSLKDQKAMFADYQRQKAVERQNELAQAENEAASSPGQADYESAIADMITTNPLAAQRYITDELRTGALTKDLFGEGGAMERYNAEEQKLASQGFKLTDEDREAYGQASGDIARMFGQEESNLAQSLADRGLASAPSGAAQIGFSGLQGNKSERLAKAQMDIADRRMQNTLNRLNSTRSHLANMGGMAQNAASNLFNRNLAGRQQNVNEMSGASGQQMQQQQAQQNQINTNFEQEVATRPPSFGDVVGGIFGGAASAAGGGLGSAIGKKAGKIFG